jgi:hypothetical protein
MSGFLSSSDIEDVVSSVRRLVSVDGRPRSVTRDLAVERLLLTPALQVVSESPAAEVRDVVVAPDVVVDAPAQPESLDIVPPVADLVPGAREEAPLPDVAEAGAGVIDEALMIEPTAPDEVLTEGAIVADPPEGEMPPEGETVVQTGTCAEEAPVEPIAIDGMADMVSEDAPVTALPNEGPEAAPEAEPNPVMPEREPLHLVVDEWEDELWAEGDPSLAEIALGAEEAELVPPDPPEADAGIFAVDDTTDPPVDPPVPPIDPDAAWAQIDGDWADDLPDPVVPFAAHRARILAQPHPVADPPRSEAVELTDPDGNPLTILDEVALQEVVRQMIREELQGGLGERITRNVRKLVRAEINRALAARALD